MIQKVLADAGGAGPVDVDSGKIARLEAEEEIRIARGDHADEKIACILSTRIFLFVSIKVSLIQAIPIIAITATIPALKTETELRVFVQVVTTAQTEEIF